MYWLVAQQGQNAEQVGKGAADALEGVAGFFSDLAASPDFGKWLGYVLLVAVGLWLLRRLGIMRG